MSLRRCLIRYLGAGALALLLCTALLGRACAITVSSELSATTLPATDTLVLRVAVHWEGGEDLYRFATPRPPENPHLRLTGQSVGGSTNLAQGAFVSDKTWLFSFVCVQPGSTQVAPPVIVCTNTETGQTDSVGGSPMLLTIGAAPTPPFDYSRLGPYLLGLAVIVIVVFAGVKFVQRRREMAQSRELHKSPKQQAAELLEQLRPLMREDQCEKFYATLEKIILGLWEARVGRRLAGKTPQEVAAILRENGFAKEEAERVGQTLTDCHTVRFGGGRVAIQTMEVSLGAVQSWVSPPENS